MRVATMAIRREGQSLKLELSPEPFQAGITVHLVA